MPIALQQPAGFRRAVFFEALADKQAGPCAVRLLMTIQHTNWKNSFAAGEDQVDISGDDLYWPLSSENTAGHVYD